MKTFNLKGFSPYRKHMRHLSRIKVPWLPILTICLIDQIRKEINAQEKVRYYILCNMSIKEIADQENVIFKR